MASNVKTSSSTPIVKIGKQKIFDSHLKRRVKGKVKAILVSNLGTRTASTSNYQEFTLDERFFAIQKRTDVCGGEPCVAGTRVTVRTLAQLNQQGETARQLADAFNLKLSQVQEALRYAERNREEINELIRQNERA